MWRLEFTERLAKVETSHSQLEAILPPRRHLAVSGDISGLSQLGRVGALGFQRVGIKDAPRHPLAHKKHLVHCQAGATSI